jgi:hypothetical protein
MLRAIEKYEVRYPILSSLGVALTASHSPRFPENQTRFARTGASSRKFSKKYPQLLIRSKLYLYRRSSYGPRRPTTWGRGAQGSPATTASAITGIIQMTGGTHVGQEGPTAARHPAKAGCHGRKQPPTRRELEQVAKRGAGGRAATRLFITRALYN